MTQYKHRLIFLHIEKAGGSTLHNILRNFYPAERTLHLEYMSNGSSEIAAMEQEPELVKGHVCFGIHKHLKSPFRYYTMMRKPEDRVLSYFYYVKQKKAHHHSSLILEKGWELDEYIQKAENLQMDNGQVRYISGSDKPFGKINQHDLDLAIKNIEQHFLTVGLTERFDESLIILKLLLGWKKFPVYEKANVNASKAKEIKPSVKEAIMEMNQYDQVLYDFVKQRFGKEFEEALMKKEMSKFSRAVQTYYLKKKLKSMIIRTPSK